MTLAEGYALAAVVEAEGYKTRGLGVIPGMPGDPIRCYLSVAGRVKCYRPEDWNDAARRKAQRRNVNAGGTA